MRFLRHFHNLMRTIRINLKRRSHIPYIRRPKMNAHKCHST